MVKNDKGQANDHNEGGRRPTRGVAYKGQYSFKKQYDYLTNRDRSRLISLIHDRGLSIKEAAKACGMNYENAKVVNRIYVVSGRKHHRYTRDFDQEQPQSEAGLAQRKEQNQIGPEIKIRDPISTTR